MPKQSTEPKNFGQIFDIRETGGISTQILGKKIIAFTINFAFLCS